MGSLRIGGVPRLLTAEKPKETKAEAKKRKLAEEEEARKAASEAERLKKEAEEKAEIERVAAMSDAEALTAALEKIGAPAEPPPPHDIQLCVAWSLRERCAADADYARKVLHPRKDMSGCSGYIGAKVVERIKKELKESGVEPGGQAVARAVPAEVCYQWAFDYFNEAPA
jgi:hypothetical protein